LKTEAQKSQIRSLGHVTKMSQCEWRGNCWLHSSKAAQRLTMDLVASLQLWSCLLPSWWKKLIFQKC